MKTGRIVFMGVLFAAATSLSAQITIGGKVGANYTIGSMKIQPEPKDAPTNPKGLGMHFGAYMGIPFSDMVGVRPELGFSFRRMNSEETTSKTYKDEQGTIQTDQGQQQMTFTGTNDERIETDQRLSYFQLNVPLTLSPSEGLRIMVGPSISFLMGGKRNVDETNYTKGTATVGGQTYNIDNEDFEGSKKKGSGAIRNFKKADMGVLAGIGYTLPVGFDMDLRYVRSLSPTFDETQGKSRHRIWSNLIEFSVGWQFGGQ